jgi:DNA-binding transcriptional LysR family regulator
MKFTLRQLEVFFATAMHENISVAADKLAITQSAASSALKDLEERYKTRLFDRIGKRLKLNEQGAELLPYVEGLLKQAEEVGDALERKEPAGTLAIGATLTIGNYLTVPLISSFKQQYPLSDIHLHIANTVQIASDVLAYRLDMGLIEGEYTHESLQLIPWREDELSVFCSPDHPLANKKSLGESDLPLVDWVLRERGSGTRQSFDRAMQGILNQLNIFMELEHTEAIKCAVDDAGVVGCISKIALEDDIRRGRFVELELTGRNMVRTLFLIKHKQKFVSQSLRRWFDHCQNSLENGEH